MMRKTSLHLGIALLVGLILNCASLFAQDVLPADNGIATYHTAPRYRESESHPLRVLAYVAHPVGWAAREVFFRPLSFFAGSTSLTRSVFGFREPYDYRQPECYSADDAAPDCRNTSPFNYGKQAAGEAAVEEVAPSGEAVAERQVYFPDVNFDFNVRKLNDLGRGRARQIAHLLEQEAGLKIVLQGHADYIGSEAYNDKLGMDRAEALRSELVSLGISAERLSTVTFGKSQPKDPASLFSQQENWARAVNRRVEVHSDTGAQATPASAGGEAPAEPAATAPDGSSETGQS